MTAFHAVQVRACPFARGCALIFGVASKQMRSLERRCCRGSACLDFCRPVGPSLGRYFDSPPHDSTSQHADPKLKTWLRASCGEEKTTPMFKTAPTRLCAELSNTPRPRTRAMRFCPGCLVLRGMCRWTLCAPSTDVGPAQGVTRTSAWRAHYTTTSYRACPTRRWVPNRWQPTVKVFVASNKRSRPCQRNNARLCWLYTSKGWATEKLLRAWAFPLLPSARGYCAPAKVCWKLLGTSDTQRQRGTVTSEQE